MRLMVSCGIIGWARSIRRLTEIICQQLVHLGAFSQFAVDEAYGVYLGAYAELHVWQSVYVLNEDIAQAVLLQLQLAHIFVPTLQRSLELHGEPCHDSVCAL